MARGCDAAARCGRTYPPLPQRPARPHTLLPNAWLTPLTHAMSFLGIEMVKSRKGKKKGTTEKKSPKLQARAPKTRKQQARKKKRVSQAEKERQRKALERVRMINDDACKRARAESRKKNMVFVLFMVAAGTSFSAGAASVASAGFVASLVAGAAGGGIAATAAAAAAAAVVSCRSTSAAAAAAVTIGDGLGALDKSIVEKLKAGGVRTIGDLQTKSIYDIALLLPIKSDSAALYVAIDKAFLDERNYPALIETLVGLAKAETSQSLLGKDGRSVPEITRDLLSTLPLEALKRFGQTLIGDHHASVRSEGMGWWWSMSTLGLNLLGVDEKKGPQIVSKRERERGGGGGGGGGGGRGGEVVHHSFLPIAARIAHSLSLVSSLVRA